MGGQHDDEHRTLTGDDARRFLEQHTSEYTNEAKTIDDTLAERGSRYGSFDEHARITQGIKQAMIDSPNWPVLDCDMREALEMIAHKVGRILNGDPFYHDSWHDIVGYAKLVADRLEPEQ
jgi:hypothetical protein